MADNQHAEVPRYPEVYPIIKPRNEPKTQLTAGQAKVMGKITDRQKCSRASYTRYRKTEAYFVEQADWNVLKAKAMYISGYKYVQICEQCINMKTGQAIGIETIAAAVKRFGWVAQRQAAKDHEKNLRAKMELELAAKAAGIFDRGRASGAQEAPRLPAADWFQTQIERAKELVDTFFETGEPEAALRLAMLVERSRLLARGKKTGSRRQQFDEDPPIFPEEEEPEDDLSLLDMAVAEQTVRVVKFDLDEDDLAAS